MKLFVNILYHHVKNGIKSLNLYQVYNFKSNSQGSDITCQKVSI